MIPESIYAIARECAQKHAENGVSLNPYSTHRMRSLWQDGFDGRPFSKLLGGVEGSVNWKAWALGVAARRIEDEKKGGAA